MMEYQKRFVLLPLDGSPESLSALKPAQALADSTGSRLHILHVCQNDLPQQEIRTHLGLKSEDAVGALIEIATGNPGPTIIERTVSDQIEAVVMATHSEADENDSITGSVSSQVLREGHASTMIVRPNSTLRHLGKILVPMDGTPSSADAIPSALKLAKASGSSIHMLHVPMPFQKKPDIEPGTLIFERSSIKGDHSQRLRDEFIERFVCCHTDYSEDIPIHLEIGTGHPTDEIIKAVDRIGADIVVASWHGQLGLGHAQTLKHLIHRSSAPVMVVKVASHKRSSHLILAD